MSNWQIAWNEFYVLRSEAIWAIRYDEVFAWDEIIDLWDGMLKGLTGMDLVNKLMFLDNSFSSSALGATNKVVAEAYEIAAWFARSYANEMLSC